MTRRGLMIRVSLAVAIYGAAIGAGCALRFRFPSREDMHYVLYRDLVPLIVAIPAAWLAYSFQRRRAYLDQLRDASAAATLAARSAIRQTRKARPTPDESATVLADLDAAIDGVRGAFRAARHARPGPVEALEAIRDGIEALGSGPEWEPSRAEAARSAIEARWAEARGTLFEGFDRVAPPSPHRRVPGESATVHRAFSAFRGRHWTTARPIREDSPTGGSR